jgi:hypothetical protein
MNTHQTIHDRGGWEIDQWTVELPDSLREMAEREATYDEQDGYPRGELWQAVAGAILGSMVLNTADGTLVVKLRVEEKAGDALAELEIELDDQ